MEEEIVFFAVKCQKKKFPWGIKTQFIFGNLLKLINPV